MLVVGVSLSIGRKFSGRNGQNPTEALCRPTHHSDFDVPGLSAHSVPSAITLRAVGRSALSDESCPSFLVIPICISPLIYEVFWHYLRLFFSPLFNTKIQKLNTYEQLQYNLSHSLYCHRHRSAPG
jgi:hypothetical protein